MYLHLYLGAAVMCISVIFLKFLSALKATSDWLMGVMNTKEEWKYAAMDFGAPSVMEDCGTPEMQLLFAHTLDIKMPV